MKTTHRKEVSVPVRQHRYLDAIKKHRGLFSKKSSTLYEFIFRRVSMHDLPKTGMLKFAKLTHIPENYHQLRDSVTNEELLDSPSKSPSR